MDNSQNVNQGEKIIMNISLQDNIQPEKEKNSNADFVNIRGNYMDVNEGEKTFKDNVAAGNRSDFIFKLAIALLIFSLAGLVVFVFIK